MKRRDFLQILALGLADLGLNGMWGCTPVKKYGTQAGTKGKAVFCLARPDNKSTTLRILDWDTLEYDDYFIPLVWPHSLVRDRKDPNTVFLFEVMGSCVKLNLATKELLKIDHTQAREMFNGHGIQTNSGEFLLCTQMSPDLQGGIVTFRDSKTLKRVALAPRECGQTHQITKLPNSNIAVCANLATMDRKPGGGVTFYDYEKREILQRVNFPYPVVHLIPISSSEIVGMGQTTKQLPKSGTSVFSYDHTSVENLAAYDTLPDNFSGPRQLFYAKLDGTHRMFWDEERKDLFRYNFGLGSIPNSQDFLSSHAETHTVIYWRNFEIVKVFHVPAPTNIVVSKDASEFIVGSNGKLKVFSLEKLSETNTISYEQRVVMVSSYPSA